MSLSFDFIFRLLIFPGFIFIFTLSMLCDWMERKIKARMQNRMGPTYTGPIGILQPMADLIKLLAKEDIVPYGTKSLLYKAAPLISFSIFMLTLLIIPIDGAEIIPGFSFEGDLVLVLAMMVIANFFLFFAGWASSNPLSTIGSARILTQLIGYDIPMFILALTPAFLARSLSISAIANAQKIPFILLMPWSFIIFVITLQAELEKDPFDIPHAETEIVAGYETEYTGRRLAFLKMSKDLQMLLGAALITELFLGGANGPLITVGFSSLWKTLWFTLKVLLIVVLMVYLTCVFARLRIDQVVVFNWKTLLPLSLISLVASVILKLFMVGG